MNAVESSWQKLSQKTVDDSLLKGWYDFLKILIDLQSNLGGIIPLVATLGVLFSKQIVSGLVVISNKIKDMTNNAAAATTAFSKMRWSMVAISAAIAIISAVVGVINEHNQKMAEARRETLDYVDSVQKTSLEIDTLYNKIKDLSSIQNKTEEQESELLTLNSDLVKILGDRATALQGLTVGTNEYTTALANLLKEEAKASLTLAQEGIIAAQRALEKDVDKRSLFSPRLQINKGDFKEVEGLYDSLNDTFTEVYQNFMLTFGGEAFTTSALDNSAGELLHYYNILLQAKKEITNTTDALLANGDAQSKQKANNLLASDSYIDLTYEIDRYKEQVEDLYQALIYQEIVSARISDTIPETKEQYESFRQSILDAIDPTEAFTEMLTPLIDSLFPSFSGVIADTSWTLNESEAAYSAYTKKLQEMSDQLEKTKSSLFGFKDSYSTLSDAIDEYSDTGSFSVETLEKLLSLSPEYLQYLVDENENISLNTEGLREYQLAQVEALRTDLLAEHVAKMEELNAAEELGVETSEEIQKQREAQLEATYNTMIVIDALITSLGEENDALELAMELFDETNSALDEAQSAYETITDAIKEYNKTGVLSVDTFQALMNLSPEFLSMFFNQATAVGNAEAAINSQVEALKLAKVQELQTAAAADILAYSQGNIAGMSPLAQAAISKVAGAALTAGGDFLTAAVDAGTFYQTVIDTAKKLGADLAGSSGAGIDAIIRAYQNAANKISNIKVSFGGGKSSGGGGGGGASAAEQQAKAIESAYDDLLSYTMKMLKKEQQDRIDALEEELDLEEELYKTEKERIEDEIDGYKEIIDKKKESLKLDKEEKEYNDDIADANKEISDLQDRLIELAFDTSESAKAERLKLQEELSKKETDLAKKQYNRGVDLAENALDTEYELYKEQQEQKLTDLEIAFEATKTDYEDRIDILKEYLEQENTIRSEAIALIEGRTAEFYNRLYEWNAKYGEVTSAVLQNIINLAHQTVSAVSRSGGGGGGDGSSKKSTTTTSSNTTTGKIPISKVLDIYGDDGDAEVSLTWGNSSSSGKSGSSSKVGTHHSGLDAGFVGGLKGNEQFVKALKGEVFINPKQQNDYMNKILPETINSSKNNIRCENLLSISVAGNIDSNSVQKIQKTVENEFQKLNKVFSGMGTTRKANSFAT